ncbi:hypothetical protein [uncultured Eubacterium sp.]|uniref:hypothetical protein n=1 Tax=uncultured Eubacterium sp. TaxID=165185 RepID=UPI0025E659FA|nr:hypothetical protein [uncultured Eubacterium sp.]
MRNFNDVINSVDEAINNAKKNGSIDEVINKTKEYAKKSAQAIEISRKRIELLDTKTKLAKAYEKYGKQQFALYEGKEVNQDELNASCEEIVMLKSQSEFLEAEIEAFKEAVAAQVDAKMNPKKDEDVVVDESDIEVVEAESE